MQVEMSAEELKIIEELAQGYGYSCGAGFTPDMEEFLERVDDLIEQAEELQALDLNDCGDACKL